MHELVSFMTSFTLLIFGIGIYIFIGSISVSVYLFKNIHRFQFSEVPLLLVWNGLLWPIAIVCDGVSHIIRRLRLHTWRK